MGGVEGILVRVWSRGDTGLWGGDIRYLNSPTTLKFTV